MKYLLSVDPKVHKIETFPPHFTNYPRYGCQGMGQGKNWDYTSDIPLLLQQLGIIVLFNSHLPKVLFFGMDKGSAAG